MLHRVRWKWGVALAGSVLCLVLVGCSGEQKANTQDDAKMRAAYQTKGFKLEDIPPEQRERVKGFMNAGKSGTPPGPGSAAASPGAPASR